jgi:Rod binding domain-containing protein
MTDIKSIMTNARFGLNHRVSSSVRSAENKASFSEQLSSAVKASKSGGSNRVQDKKLMDTCVEMESLFVAKMFKEMRKTVHKGDWLNGGFAEEVFEDMLYDEHALNLSKNTKLGIAGMLYKELSKTG